MKFPYGPIGTETTRILRNLVNKIFGDIEEDMKSLARRISDTNLRISNLILNKSDLPEITDARQDAEGNIHPVLKDRLDSDFENFKAKLDKSIHITDFNAIGDGLVDDTSAIQAALDYAFSVGGAVVYAPPGKYKYTKTLIIKENVTLLLDDNAHFLKFHLDEALSNYEKVKGSVKLTGYNGESNITVIGGVWDNQGTQYPGGQGLVFAHAKNIKIINTKILDVSGGHAVEANGVDTCLIDGVEARGFSGESYRGAIQIDLDKEGSPATLGEFGSFDGTPCRNITVRNCKIGASDKMGAWGRGIETHSSFVGISHENIHIYENYIENTLNAAIRGYGWNKVTIHENIIVNCGSGIIVNALLLNKPEDLYDVNGNFIGTSQIQTDISIKDNIIDVVTMTTGLVGGIAVWGQGNGGTLQNIQIDGNTIKNTPAKSNAIYVKRCENGNIINNIIENSGQNGISVTSSKSLNITNNLLNGVAITGIYCQNENFNDDTDQTDDTSISEALNVTNNHLKNLGGHGIHVQNNKFSKVQHNVVRNAGALLLNRYNGVFISTNCTAVSVTGNSIISESKQLIAGINITNTNSVVYESNNFVPYAENYYENPIVNLTIN